MTDEVPPDKPETTPVVAPIVATLVFPLAHVPPPDASLKAVVAPAHSMVVPVIPEGKALTVTVATALSITGCWLQALPASITLVKEKVIIPEVAVGAESVITVYVAAVEILLATPFIV